MNSLLLRAALLFVILPIQVVAQIKVTGIVVDKNTGESLPAATVIIENTFRGTITNENGRFSINVTQLPVTLQVSYIGYEKALVRVENRDDLPLEILLETSITEMEEVVVTDKDPGLTIMERVIERKKIWREALRSYQANAYTRQVLENDTSIVSITESNSLLYWQRNEGYREIQTSTRQTSNLSSDQNFAGVRYTPNFYDDDIEIAGYSIVGITHPDALSFYHFSLLEVLQMDGVPVYKIEVKPRRKLQPTFEGVAYVLGRKYALIDVDLSPNDVVSFPPPVQDFNLSYKQQFSNYGKDFWLPVDMRIEGRIRIGMVGLRFPAIQFRQISRISDYEINISLPDSIFNDQSISVKTDTTLLMDPSFNEVPLTKEEQMAYEQIDSTKTIEEAFRPEGFLARAVSESEGGSGILTEIGDLMPGGSGVRGRYNRIEGAHLGLKYERILKSTGLNMSVFGGYSFNSEMWDYGGEAEKSLKNFGNKNLSVSLSYKNSIDTQYESGIYTGGMNSVVTLLGGDDYFNYYRNEQFSAGLAFKNIVDKLDLEFFGNHEVHRSFNAGNEIDFNLFNWEKIRRENPEIDDGTLRSITARVGFNEQERNFGFAGARQFQLMAEFSHPDLGSDFDFTSISMRLDWNFETFYQRRLFANTLDIHLSAGVIEGDVPIQKLGAVDGSLSRFTPFSVLKTKPYLPYVGNIFGIAVTEHNFRTLPFELLGLNYFVEKGWGVILFGGAGIANLNDEVSYIKMDSDGIHTEAGVSLNSIFGIMRLDFAKRLDSPGYFIGISVPRYF